MLNPERNQMRLLLVEDEKDLNNILTKKLTDDGYSVDSCFDGEAALDYFASTEYDGALLDVMLPKLDGFSLLLTIRKSGIKTPVLFLTSRDAISDRIRGLDLGADDYVVKPFSMDELTARVRALVRRSFDSKSSVLTADDLEIDLSSHRVSRGGRQIELSAKEYSLLVYLAHNKNTVLSRDKIEDHIWNFDYEGGTNVVDVYISYLRKKIDDGYENKLIHTVRGAGYMLKSRDGNEKP